MTTNQFLGRIPDTHRSSDLKFGDYVDRPKLRAALADRAASAIGRIAHPAAPDWTLFPTPDGSRPRHDRDPLGNDECGDCVLAAPGHMNNLIGQQIGDQNLVVTAEQVKHKYFELTGGRDIGFIIREMLDIWATEGLFGTKLLAACAVDKNDQELVAAATWSGCGLIGGYDLPVATETQGDLWFVPPGGFGHGDYPGKRGGHCMFAPGTSPAADAFISWGDPITGTTAWRGACCSELWLCFVDRWITATGRAPNGLSLADLLSDWSAR